MKKVLFIYRIDQADPNNQGIVLKLKGQMEAFRSLGWSAERVIQDGSKILCADQVIHTMSGHSRWYDQWRWYDRLEKVTHQSYNFVIIRYGISTAAKSRWIKKYKSLHPKVQIIWDMPTYPYTHEWSGVSGKIILAIDRQYRSQALPHIDAILHSGREEELWGVPTIHFPNGISADAVPLRKAKTHQGLRLIAVGKWRHWHGLDRLVHGMIHDRELVESHDIHLTIIGDGPALQDLRAVIAHHDWLQPRIKLRGSLNGPALDREFDQADIAIGTLGLHRKGVTINSSLKHREYAMRGIPLILSSEDSDFDTALRFVRYVPTDDSDIRIEELIKFYDSTGIISGDQIRSFAVAQLSWKSRICHILAALSAEGSS